MTIRGATRLGGLGLTHPMIAEWIKTGLTSIKAQGFTAEYADIVAETLVSAADVGGSHSRSSSYERISSILVFT